MPLQPSNLGLCCHSMRVPSLTAGLCVYAHTHARTYAHSLSSARSFARWLSRAADRNTRSATSRNSAASASSSLMPPMPSLPSRTLRSPSPALTLAHCYTLLHSHSYTLCLDESEPPHGPKSSTHSCTLTRRTCACKMVASCPCNGDVRLAVLTRLTRR